MPDPAEVLAPPEAAQGLARDLASIDPLAPWVEGARMGNASAMQRLLEAITPQVFVAVRAILGRKRSDLEDIAQESLVHLVQALPAFRGECGITHYACRIAVRTALAARRKNAAKLQQEAELQIASERTHEGPTPPDEQSLATRRRELIRQLIDTLPSAQADTVALRLALGYSMQEVAEATGVPVNTVRSRLRLAKEALRKRIEDDPRALEMLEVPDEPS